MENIISSIKNEMCPVLVEIAMQDMGSMYQQEIQNELLNIENGNCLGLCAIVDGKPIGYVTAKRTIDTYHLLTIAVDKQHRNKGYGTLLLNKLFSEIEKYGSRILNVITDADANDSVRFYLKNGFSLTGIVQDEFIPGVAQVHLTRRMGYNP